VDDLHAAVTILKTLIKSLHDFFTRILPSLAGMGHIDLQQALERFATNGLPTLRALPVPMRLDRNLAVRA
jgi:hypothetical protein